GRVDGCRGTGRYDRLAGTRRIRKTKWKGSSTREGNGYKLWYSGSSSARNEKLLDLEDDMSTSSADQLWNTLARAIKDAAKDSLDVVKSTEGLNNVIKKWRKALEDTGLQVSREKTEYLRCDFDRYRVVYQEVDIHIGDRILQPKESLRYLGSVIHISGIIDDDVAHHIRAEWVK
nr:ataxia telangiectasia mutated family protein [Tanacetum cinerariifolium]